MRLRLVLVGLITMALPLYAPPAAQAKAPKPKTLVVAVTGLPNRAKATLKVSGPKKFHKTVRTHSGKTFKGLRPGTYRVRVKKVDGYTNTVKPRKARITKKHGARVTVRFRQAEANKPDAPQKQVIPPEPFPAMGSVRSVALVSASATGTPGDQFSAYPTWSPDGSRVAFASCAGNLVTTPKSGCYVFVKTLTGAAITRLDKAGLKELWTLQNDWSGELAWSPSSDRIAFTTPLPLAADTDTWKDVYVVSADGSTVKRAYPSTLSGSVVPRADDPAWSRDGTKLLFSTSDKGYAPGSGDLLVNDGTSAPTARLGSADWSIQFAWADNASVFFTATSGDRFALFRQGFGATAQVVRDGLDSGLFAPSPTGAQVAVVAWDPLVPQDTNEGADIYGLPLAGGPPARLSVGTGGEQTLWEPDMPTWSPDGTKLAFTATAPAKGQMLLVKDLASGAVTRVTPPQYEYICTEWEPSEDGGQDCVNDVTNASFIREIAWSPDGTRIAFSSNVNDLAPGDGRWTMDVFVATL